MIPATRERLAASRMAGFGARQEVGVPVSCHVFEDLTFTHLGPAAVGKRAFALVTDNL